MHGERRGSYIVLMGKPEEGDRLESLGLHGRIILRWIFKKWVGGLDWTDLAQDRDR